MTEEPPLRKVIHDHRVELGKQISDKILETFKEDVLAVLITGSTAKALDRPYSDLEMIVVVKDSREIPTKYYIHDGLLIQLDYKQESAFLKSTRESGLHDWPMSADESRNRIVLFERDGWTHKLVEAVELNDRSEFSTSLRFSALMMTESLAAVRNADLKNDALDLRTRAFWMAWDTARVVYLLNRKYILTTSWYWKQLFECAEQPKDLRKLIHIVAGFRPSSREQLAEAAELLWRETMILVRKRGISIESSEILV